jgi:hypothetical protein
VHFHIYHFCYVFDEILMEVTIYKCLNYKSKIHQTGNGFCQKVCDGVFNIRRLWRYWQLLLEDCINLANLPNSI